MTDEAPAKARMSETIANALQDDIVGLPVGTKMPTEAQLAERFAVSRTVVREAAKLLVQRGLVTVKPGRGMTVAAVDGRIIAEQYGLLLELSGGTFEQLLELRLVLEVEMAALASARHTQDHLVAMQAANDRLTAADPASSEFLDADLTFHDVIAQASGNPFFPLAIRPINTFLRDTYTEGVGYPSQAGHTVHEHIEIADAIAAGDPARARFATEQHLRRIVRNRSAFSRERTGLAKPS
jgi:GntR family transcriptional regulator, transcriptional repressor for pyruvate dehydrogenase complex